MDRLSLPVSPESVQDFFDRPEWDYARLFLLEARDQAVTSLAETDPRDIHTIARLQQEVESLTVFVGEDERYESLEDAMKEELKNYLREQEEDNG